MAGQGISSSDQYDCAVHKILKDHDCPQRNVIVSGLPETDDCETDKAVFESFCEENLTIKPVIKSCRRLGKVNSINTSKSRFNFPLLRMPKSFADPQPF